ncbi:MAG: septum formation initiator family protein [Candidatus Omnitrophica bacterium]|nr:septum formation initiator family protein [Candidatus Omnitrophota bacterium]
MKLKLGIIIAIIILGILFFPAYSKMQKLTLRDEALSRKVEELKLENEQLVQENELLTNDLVYIEEVAREKLKMARENEVVFRIVNQGEE